MIFDSIFYTFSQTVLSIDNSSYNIPHASLCFTLNLRYCGAGIDVRDKHVQGSRKSRMRTANVQTPRSSPLRDVSFLRETSFSGDERGETSAVRRLTEVKNNSLDSVKNTTQFFSRSRKLLTEVQTVGSVGQKRRGHDGTGKTFNCTEKPVLLLRNSN